MQNYEPRCQRYAPSRQSRRPKKPRQTRLFGVSRGRWVRSHRPLFIISHAVAQDISKIKEEMKEKEIIKEAEQRRQGAFERFRMMSPCFSSVVIRPALRPYACMRMQTKLTMPKRERLSARRSKRIRKPAQRNPRGKRHSERDDRLSMRLDPLLPLRQRLLPPPRAAIAQ